MSRRLNFGAKNSSIMLRLLSGKDSITENAFYVTQPMQNRIGTKYIQLSNRHYNKWVKLENEIGNKYITIEQALQQVAPETTGHTNRHLNKIGNNYNYILKNKMETHDKAKHHTNDIAGELKFQYIHTLEFKNI